MGYELHQNMCLSALSVLPDLIYLVIFLFFYVNSICVQLFLLVRGRLYGDGINKDVS